MKTKITITIIALSVISCLLGSYFAYQNYFRFTDAFTPCPVAEFRESATTDAARLSFVTETSMQSLAITERCSLDCRHDNLMACVLYGIALNEGIFVMKDPNEAQTTLKNACDDGEQTACSMGQLVAENLKKAKENAARAKAIREGARLLKKINGLKKETSNTISQSLSHFKGNKTPMMSKALLGWYHDTCNYLLFDSPLLAQMHTVSGSTIDKENLKAFVLAKYVTGQANPDIDLIDAFFKKFLRLGVQQIKLDYRVENKKESRLPKKHDYFRAKHTFLYHAATTKQEILTILAKKIEQ